MPPALDDEGCIKECVETGLNTNPLKKGIVNGIIIIVTRLSETRLPDIQNYVFGGIEG